MKDSKIYKIMSIYCNEKDVITMRNLTGLMLDISTIQAERVEKNLSSMDNKVWLLFFWDIEIIKPVRKDYEVEITTIPTHMKRFYAYRNFYVKKDGKTLIRAKASFILFDKEKLRASIIDKEVSDAYGISSEIYQGRDYEKANNFEKSKEISIRRADFDKNYHVNNGVYFDYIKDISGFDEEKVSYIKMIYKNQIKDEEKVKLNYKTGDFKVDFKIESKNEHAFGVVKYV